MLRLFRTNRGPRSTPSQAPTDLDAVTPSPGGSASETLAGTPIGPAGPLLDRLERSGVRTRVSVRGTLDDVPEATGSAALLVVRHALDDAKHDGTIDLRVREDHGELAVTIYSLPRPGRGVDADRPDTSTCALREPVARVNGTVVSRCTSAGWIVTARFPRVAVAA
ncbi:hypothetical protein [Patulibacter americanus]|uniref:hypothetical protein n=1 Tax=Patulibacter americanus TaxID=588672 RepID=UPI0003B71A22|nr:hypothetical protein [Patulibacter americanus]